MLFKLLKRDFISTGRIMGVIYILVAGFSAITLISHFLNKSNTASLTEALGVFVLLLVSLCLFVLTVVIVLTDFHKSLYGEQGYLTFTIPVKSWQILTSKVLVSSIWFVVALAALLGSFWITAIVFKEEIIGDSYDLIKEIISQVSTVSIPAIIASIVTRIILFFIQFAFFTITVFFTSTLANTRLFQKKSVLWTIVLFVPIAVIAVKIANFLNSKLVFALFFVDDKLQLVTNNDVYQTLVLNNNSPIEIASIFVYLVLGAGIFFATHYIMSKKVNIR